MLRRRRCTLCYITMFTITKLFASLLVLPPGIPPRRIIIRYPIVDLWLILNITITHDNNFSEKDFDAANNNCSNDSENTQYLR